MQLENLLQEYGLTEKEARIYLAGLELGTVPASMIARKIGENRITVYSALQMLCKKGMSMEHTKNGKKFYIMIDPKEFYEKMDERCERLNQVIPELLALNSGNNKNKPKVSYYEGFDGLKKIYEDTLESKEEILTFTGVSDIDPRVYQYLFEEYKKKRIEKKLNTRLIYPNNQIGLQGKLSQLKDQYREIMQVSKETYGMKNDISIYGDNKVAIIMFSTNEMSGVILESSSLHDSFRNLFNLIWDSGI